MGNAVWGQAIPFWKALSKKGWTFQKGMRLLLAPVLWKVTNSHRSSLRLFALVTVVTWSPLCNSLQDSPSRTALWTAFQDSVVLRYMHIWGSGTSGPDPHLGLSMGSEQRINVSTVDNAHRLYLSMIKDIVRYTVVMILSVVMIHVSHSSYALHTISYSAYYAVHTVWYLSSRARLRALQSVAHQLKWVLSSFPIISYSCIYSIVLLRYSTT